MHFYRKQLVKNRINARALNNDNVEYFKVITIDYLII